MSTLGHWFTAGPWPSFQLTANERAAIVACGLGLDPLVARTHPERMLQTEECARLAEIAERLAQGEPLAYILGRAWFYGLSLMVSPAVLIPRPDTEVLVECAVTLGRSRPALRVLDVCTGSGAVALALKSLQPDWRIEGSDLSTDALAIARANSAQLGLEIHWRQADWLEGADGLDLIVANPPYIDRSDPRVEHSVRQFEPHLALFADENGLFGLRHLLATAPKVLRPGGWIALEHGPEQARPLQELGAKLGYCQHRLLPDMAGRDRVSAWCWEG